MVIVKVQHFFRFCKYLLLEIAKTALNVLTFSPPYGKRDNVSSCIFSAFAKLMITKIIDVASYTKIDENTVFNVKNVIF